jgi:hypothetical protein
VAGTTRRNAWAVLYREDVQTALGVSRNRKEGEKVAGDEAYIIKFTKLT